MSTPKASYQTFQSDWASTQQWAQKNHIAPSAYMPVYQLDSARLLQYGYGMSQGERTNAILAAAGRGVTQLPSDNPSPTNVWGNLETNASQLFTGLNPVSMVKNLFDTATNAIEHPEQQIFDPLMDLAKISTPFSSNDARQQAMNDFSKTILGPHSLGSFVPGFFDAAELYRGKAGDRYLLDNPITALLTVVPIGKLGMLGLSKTALGESLAQSAGVAAEELGHMTPSQLAFKLIKRRPTNIKSFMKLPDGTPSGKTTFANITTGERITALRNSLGIGKDQMDIEQSLRQRESAAEAAEIDFTKGVDDSFKALSDDSKRKVYTYLALDYGKDFRPDSTITHDSSLFTPKEGEALQQYLDFRHTFNNMRLNSDETIVVDTQAGPEIYLASERSRAQPILRAKAALDDAKDSLDEATHSFDELLAETQDLDSLFGHVFPQIIASKNNFYSFIKSSLPDLDNGPLVDKLRESLPVEQRFARDVTPKSKLATAKNLEDLFGLDEKVESLVDRGSKQVAPFTGPMKEWSDAERQSWYEAEKNLTKTGPGTRDKSGVTRAQIKDNAIARLKLLGNLRDVKTHSPVPLSTAKTLAELISPGGLLDQIQSSFDNQKWDDLKALSAVAKRKINGKAFQSPTSAKPLTDLVSAINNIAYYSSKRKSLTDRLVAQWFGTKRGTGRLIQSGKLAAKNSVSELTKKYDRAAENFKRASIEHPPAVWDNYKQIEYARLLMETDEGKERAQAAIDQLAKEGVNVANVTALSQDPRFVTELLDLASAESLENHMLPNVNPGLAKEISDSANQLIYDMRVKGIVNDKTPLYLPTLKESDRLSAEKGQVHNINLHKTRISKQQALHEKLSTNTSRSTIYDYVAAMHKEVREYVTQKAELDFQEKDMPHYLYHWADMVPYIRSTFQDEMVDYVSSHGGDRLADLDSFYKNKLAELNMVSYDPSSIWGITHPNYLRGQYFIDKDIAKALDETWNGDNAISRTFARGTDIFRTSILGYSLRFAAHVIVGGGLMFAATADKSVFKNLPLAWEMVKTGKIPDEVISKYNLGAEDPYLLHGKLMAPGSMQGGAADHFYNHALGYSQGQLTIQERIAEKFGRDAADLKNPDWFTHYLNVLPELNYRTTTFASNLYRSLALLQGLGKAAKTGHFYDDVYDETTKSVTRVRKDMTPDQMLHEAFQHVDKVMGDVRSMSPLERNFLTRIFPFWTWTRHVLQYVVHFPADHPYRAMTLANLSWMSQQELPAGLPLRTQLLFFLGQPDPQGNVKAVDMRALNPLRDTAQYMTLSGWLSSLNPIISAPFSKVDPNITFGTNVLYPSITYDSLYGTNDAQQQGTLWQTAEGVVPELSALDAALNLSGQYSYLKSTNRNAFYTKIFSSLNIPFLQEQSVNLRQIAANNEIKRYNEAKAAGATAWQTGDFSALNGYSEVPDPRYGTSPLPNITPTNLKAIYDQIATQYAGTGLTPANVTPEQYNPTL